MSSSPPIDNGHCFACGPRNPIGLHLHFEADAHESGGVCASVVLAPEFQGWQGIAHGGISIALLDEAMAHAAGAAGHRGMTASMNVRFRKPVPLGERLDVRGRVAWTRRNVLGLEARVLAPDGRVLLHAEGHFVSMGSLDAVADRRNPSISDA